jgi:gliding motility-associated-like protein
LPQTIDDYSAKLEEKFNALLSPTDKLFIPNLITPNNDGINDCFEIRDIEKFSSVYVAIYSRDKKLIYENKKYDNSWCPTDVPDGVYFCCVKVSDEKYRPAWVTVHIKTK